MKSLLAAVLAYLICLAPFGAMAALVLWLIEPPPVSVCTKVDPAVEIHTVKRSEGRVWM